MRRGVGEAVGDRTGEAVESSAETTVGRLLISSLTYFDGGHARERGNAYWVLHVLIMPPKQLHLLLPHLPTYRNDKTQILVWSSTQLQQSLKEMRALSLFFKGGCAFRGLLVQSNQAAPKINASELFLSFHCAEALAFRGTTT